LLIVVAGLHVAIIYGLMLATGVVKQPAFVQPLEAVFVPEATQPEEQPEIKVKPEINQPVAVDGSSVRGSGDAADRCASAGLCERDQRLAAAGRASAGSEDRQSRRPGVPAGFASSG
jgi:hypothetical protein